jgi:uncharacterized protein
MLVGVISDTHGLLRPEAIDALRGSAMIIHAGEVGKAAVLERLHGISPVIAVRGNIDTEPWAASLPESAIVAAGAHRILVLHDLSQLAVDPAQAGLAAVVFGHSHKPSIEKRAGVLYLNPGSAAHAASGYQPRWPASPCRRLPSSPKSLPYPYPRQT